MQITLRGTLPSPINHPGLWVKILPCVSSKTTYEFNSDIPSFSTPPPFPCLTLARYHHRKPPQVCSSWAGVCSSLSPLHIFLRSFGGQNFIWGWFYWMLKLTICGAAFPMTGVPLSGKWHNKSGTKIRIKRFQQESNWALMTLNVRSMKSLSWGSSCSLGLEKQHTAKMSSQTVPFPCCPLQTTPFPQPCCNKEPSFCWDHHTKKCCHFTQIMAGFLKPGSLSSTATMKIHVLHRWLIKIWTQFKVRERKHSYSHTACIAAYTSPVTVTETLSQRSPIAAG